MRWLAAFLLLLSCTTTLDPMKHVEPGGTVVLQVLESARIEPDGIVLQFAAVDSESRCPSGVQCVWEGDAEIILRVTAEDGESAELRLHTSGSRERSAGFAGRTIELIQLDPYPVQAGIPRQSEYQATLAIE